MFPSRRLANDRKASLRVGRTGAGWPDDTERLDQEAWCFALPRQGFLSAGHRQCSQKSCIELWLSRTYQQHV
jgi:hypothetical protein